MTRKSSRPGSTPLPAGLAAPARRSLAHAGVETLEHLVQLGRAPARRDAGICPRTLAQLQDAMDEHGLELPAGSLAAAGGRHRPGTALPGSRPGRYRLNPMTEYRRVGNSGLTVSVVGLGCNNLGRANTATESQEGTDAVVHAALDAGITFFDVADTYGREPGPQRDACWARPSTAAATTP